MASSRTATGRSSRRPGRPPGQRDASGEEVRQRLLDAATALAVEHGLDGAGIREIAQRAGVSSGMIAYYFGDRRGLHEAMFLRAIERLVREFEAALASPGDDCDALDTMIRLHATALAADPWLPRLIARELLGGDGSLRERFSELVGEGPLPLMRDAIAEAIARGELRADLDPTMCVLSIAGATAFPYLAGPLLGKQLGIEIDDDFRDRLIAHNRDLIAHGLRAPAPEEVHE